MKALVFNPFSGAAGDMILGCALDLGADRKAIKELIETSILVAVDVKEVLKKELRLWMFESRFLTRGRLALILNLWTS